MAVADKKLKPKEKKTRDEEKKVEITAASQHSKMLTLKMEELDNDARMTVQSHPPQNVKRLKEEGGGREGGAWQGGAGNRVSLDARIAGLAWQRIHRTEILL